MSKNPGRSDASADFSRIRNGCGMFCAFTQYTVFLVVSDALWWRGVGLASV
jgi:hypothetical protein